jgi:hypothetical protein
MPLEIKELVINVTVSQPAQGGGATPAPQGGGDAKAMVKQVVEEVMAIVHNKQER